MHTLHRLIWSICACPFHIVWTTPLSFLKTSLSLYSPISPSTSLASCPSSWWHLRSAFPVKVSTDAHWSLSNLLSSLKSDPKKRDFCEKVWERMSAAQTPAWDILKLKMCLIYLYLMFYSDLSPLLPLQRRDPLCPQKTCRGRRGGPGPSSGQLKGYVYLLSEY